ACDRLAGRSYTAAPAPVRLRMIALQTLRDLVDLRGRLGDSGAGPQTSGEPVLAPIARQTGIESERNPEIDLTQIANLDLRRQHTSDRVRFAVERQRLPDDRRAAAELPLPELMAEHDHVLRARCIVSRREPAAGNSGEPPDLEEVRRRFVRAQSHGVAAAGHRQRRPRHGSDRLEQMQRLAQIEEIGKRGAPAVAAALGVDREDPAETLLMLHWQGPDEQHIGETEDDRVRADREGEGQDDDEGIAWLSQQDPCAVDEILNYGAHDAVCLWC